MKETNILKETMMEASKLGLVVFRNNRGLFYTLDKKRKVRAGIEMNGSCDLIGWTKIKIDSSMVGKYIAVFTAIEVKTEKGVLSKEQAHFIKKSSEDGAMSFEIRDHKSLIEKINAYRKKLCSM